MQTKNGFLDSDKVLVTVALWIASLSIFFMALTLPMLPSDVTIFIKPTDGIFADEYYSKYNNLLLVLTAVIPIAVIVVAAILKRRNRAINNYISINLFAIMLSLCMSGVIVYGISEQFGANVSVDSINIHSVITVLLCALFSVFSSVMPTIVHGKKSTAPYPAVTAERWYIPAFGYLVCAIACSFIPDAYSYIVFGAMLLAKEITFIALASKKKNTPPATQEEEQQ